MPAKPSFKSLATWIADTAAALLLATSPQATLVGRDISGNDMAWAADLTVGSFSDWRLSPGVRNCSFNCGELGHLWYDELGNALNGNQQVIGTLNTGDFQNLPTASPGYLWTSTETDATHAFAFGSGRQDNDIKESSGLFIAEYQALAVRDGDLLRTVTPPNGVPEPGTLLLTAAALLGLGVVRRKRGLNQASA